MEWICPSCGCEDNDAGILRCACGYELSHTEDFNYERIDGGLLLAAFGLFLTSALNAISASSSLDKASEITATMVASAGFIALLYVLVPLILLVFLLRRKRFLPKLIISYYVLNFVVALLGYFGAKMLNGSPGFEKILYEAKSWLLIAGIACVIWTPYFMFSPRVKGTFTR